MTHSPRTAAEILTIENGGRPASQVWGTRGMVCSMHPEATNAAVEILRAGGNAVDAGIALGASLGVASPNWAGIGGESVWLVYWAKSNQFFFMDGYSTCPASMNPDALIRHFNLGPEANSAAYQEEPPDVRHTGVITAMTPGTPAAWVELSQRFGKLSFATLFEGAIALARNGLPINRYLATSLRDFKARIALYESSRRIFCKPNGEPLGEGDTLIQPDLADTYERLAARESDDFYKGETARLIADYCKTHGGLITVADLANYRAVWRLPHHGRYRNLEIVVTGAPTCGVHVLQGLNILEGFPLREMGYHTADSLHVLIEATKLVLSDRRACAEDPDFITVDVDRLLDKDYAERLRATIRPLQVAHAPETAITTADSTSHFVVIDGDGNIVSATQTIGAAFGCCEVVDGTGIVMNDRSWWMSLKQGPNMVAPGRRANIGHAPTIAMSGGKPYFALGSPGGFGIVQFVLQTIINMVDHGLDIQDAIEAPRFRVEGLGPRVWVEDRIARPVRETLRQWGHEVLDFPPWTDRVGGVEGLCIDPNTRNILGGYDPRRNSAAVGIGT